jgi:hypothetical protein
MDRKKLLKVTDLILEKIEKTNLEGDFSPTMGETVQKLEWLLYTEAGSDPPRVRQPPQDGVEAHDRLMTAQWCLMAAHPPY